ncbi:MAG: FKBP-type peptidyl-prolyl cis-trans isomerase [Akkermansiaceae bacterium]
MFSRNVTLVCISLIAVLIGLIVFWPDKKSDAAENAQKDRYGRQTDVSGSSDSKADQARSAIRARTTGKNAPQKIRTESGLVYQVLQKGTGDRPSIEENVKVSYRGYLPDGTEFDSTQEGESRTFPVKAVIRGWAEGIQLMRVGSRYRFIIPPELAYGEKGVGGMIKPNQTLIFEVELLAIKAPANEK